MKSTAPTPTEKLATGKNKMAKAQATIRFLAKAKIKDFGDKGWYAYVPGETPLQMLVYLEKSPQTG